MTKKTQEEKGKNQLILIVDDIPENLKVLGLVLKKSNYPFSIALNGKEALEKVSLLNPDLILLDINMPVMNGFEVCKKLKSSSKTSHIPIIFLTAKVDTEDIVKGFEIGAADYITKPFNPRELLARIKTHLSLKKANDDIKMFERENTINAMAITANHEINQPLTVLQGNIELFTRSFGGKQLTDKQNKYIYKMQNSIDNISDILKKFQNFKSSKIEEYIKDRNMVVFEEKQ